MEKMLRRRFVQGAMLSFAILILLIASGVFLMNYVQMETASGQMLEVMLSQDEISRRPPDFDQRRNRRPWEEERFFPGAAHDIRVDAEGNVLAMQSLGFTHTSQEELSQLAADILSLDSPRGKQGAFRYEIVTEAGGVRRLVLVDNSVQMHVLMETLRGTALMAVVSLLLLFVILQPVARRVSRAWLRNINSQKEFITNASHELKTPVAIMTANLDAMELMMGENRWSQNIRGQAARLTRLIAQLMMISRLDEGLAREQKHTVDWSALVRAELENYREPMARKKLTLDAQVEDGLTLRGHGEALGQLMRMLLDNAVQYAQEGGSIRLTAHSRHRNAVLQLDNSVTTLPSCPPECLFERFTRGDAAHNQQTGGCGIGLSAARSIAQAHKGAVTAAYPDEHTFRVMVTLARG